VNWVFDGDFIGGTGANFGGTDVAGGSIDGNDLHQFARTQEVGFLAVEALGAGFTGQPGTPKGIGLVQFILQIRATEISGTQQQAGETEGGDTFVGMHATINGTFTVTAAGVCAPLAVLSPTRPLISAIR